jgi:purine nucleosidase
VLLALMLFATAQAWCRTSVILSTDVGNEIDDQWAIIYMLTNPDFDVRAIISAHGPSLPDPSAHATYLVLKDEVEGHLAMSVHPPLFEGSSLPLADRKTPRGNDGVNYLIETSREFSPDHRLVVLTIGAATDVASALLQDPSLAHRIHIVAMGFKSQTEGREYNVENDPKAWQVLLDSKTPLTIGAGDVCREFLALGFQQAKDLVGSHGPVGAWLWQEYQDWYFRSVKPLRVNDFSKPWIIWDIITLAYVEGLTKQTTQPRPSLSDDFVLSAGKGNEGKVEWITEVDSARLWKEFVRYLDQYQRTHDVSRVLPR